MPSPSLSAAAAAAQPAGPPPPSAAARRQWPHGHGAPEDARDELPSFVARMAAAAESAAAAAESGGTPLGELLARCAGELRELVELARDEGTRFDAGDAVGAALPVLMVAEEVAGQPPPAQALRRRRSAAAELLDALEAEEITARAADRVGDFEQHEALRGRIIRGWDQRVDMAVAACAAIDDMAASLRAIVESGELGAEAAEAGPAAAARRRARRAELEARAVELDGAAARCAAEEDAVTAEAAAEMARLNAQLLAFAAREEAAQAALARWAAELDAVRAERERAMEAQMDAERGRRERIEQARRAARAARAERERIRAPIAAAVLAENAAECVAGFLASAHRRLVDFAAARLSDAERERDTEWQGLDDALVGLFVALGAMDKDAARREEGQRDAAAAARMRVELAAETFDPVARHHAAGAAAAAHRAQEFAAERDELRRAARRQNATIERARVTAREQGRVWRDPRTAGKWACDRPAALDPVPLPGSRASLTVTAAV